MKTLQALALLALLPAAALVSCKTDAPAADTTRRPAVDPPLASLVPYRDFNISAEAGDTILLDEGTALYVPAGIFIDKNGKPVKGDVQLHYRAFYTPGEIIASGITMLYDSAGTEHTFTSAGMFELTGTQGGEPVTIAPGKSIAMDFATTRNDMSFSFYALDTTASKWNFINTPKLEGNKMRGQLEKAIAAFVPRPVEPRKYDPKRPVLDLDVNTNDHPELAGYTGIMWQYAGSGADPGKSTDLYSTMWTSARLDLLDEATCLYNLTLSDGSKKFSTNVFPALSGKNYETALTLFKKNIREFEEKEKVRQAKREQQRAMAEFQYSLRMNSFGIFNCDAFPFNWVASVPMEFHFSDPEFEENRGNVVVFIVSGNNTLVCGYNGASTPNVRYITETRNAFVAVMRGTNKVAIAGDADFRSMVANDPDRVSKVTLKSTSKKVSNSKELDALIAAL